MKIAGNVAVISGGASGLGEATARHLAEHGARVAITDRDEERGNALAEALGRDAAFFRIDITDDATAEAGIAEITERFGAIHMLINTAGIGAPAKVLGRDNAPIDMDVFRRVVNVNLFGTMNMIRFAAAVMRANEPDADGERGVMITTSSNASTDGQIGQSSYTASKAALNGITLPIAREFADYGIRINAIAPGLFDTPLLHQLPEEVRAALGRMVPFPNRLGKPSEYASLAREIIENGMINGEVLRLDGALRMTAK